MKSKFRNIILAVILLCFMMAPMFSVYGIYCIIWGQEAVENIIGDGPNPHKLLDIRFWIWLAATLLGMIYMVISSLIIIYLPVMARAPEGDRGLNRGRLYLGNWLFGFYGRKIDEYLANNQKIMKDT